MAGVELSADKKTEFLDAFELFDKNGDGKISAAELLQVSVSRACTFEPYV